MDGERQVFDRDPAADLWRHTLSQIPTLFGRLAYLSSLRNSNSGVYEHHGLALVHGDELADRVLRESHVAAFMEWLNYPLERQKADLDFYLSSFDGPRRTIVDTWAKLAPYRTFLPTNVREVERNLFLSDVQILLELLKNEYGVVFPDPNA